MAIGDHPKHAEFVIAIFSCILTFGVILSFCIFPKMWNKIFMRIIFYAAVSVFIANATFFSQTPTDRDLCFFQGFFQQLFYPASWIWTTILAYLIYSLVLHGKIEMEELMMHAYGWGIPILATLLPLTTSTYRRDQDDDGICWLQPTQSRFSEWNLFWQVLTFTVIGCTCCFIMAYFGCVMFYKIRIQKVQCSPSVVNAMNTLFIYPIIIVFCWLPVALQAAIYPGYAANSNIIVGVTSLSILQGGLSALAFFVNSKETRNNWLNLFAKLFPFCAGFLLAKKPKEAEAVSRPTISYATEDEEDFADDEEYTGGKSMGFRPSSARTWGGGAGSGSGSGSNTGGVPAANPTISPLGQLGNGANDEQL
jgi:hypothetical protein